MATVGRGAAQYTVRFPEGLRDRIRAAADDNGRSMNAEIIDALEARYPPLDLVSLHRDMLVDVHRSTEAFLHSYKRGEDVPKSAWLLHLTLWNVLDTVATAKTEAADSLAYYGTYANFQALSEIIGHKHPRGELGDRPSLG